VRSRIPRAVSVDILLPKYKTAMFVHGSPGQDHSAQQEGNAETALCSRRQTSVANEVFLKSALMGHWLRNRVVFIT